MHDKGIYKKKRSWQLEELKLVDGRENHEFDLTFLDQRYNFAAINLNEKQTFLTILWKQVNKSSITNKAIFRNIPDAWMNESQVLDSTLAKQESLNVSTDEETDEFDDVNELSELEKMIEYESSKWISGCNSAIRNADQFIEHLTNNLIELDGANVASILASKAEEQVLSLLQQIDSAIDEVEIVEKTLDEYEDVMSNIRDSMKQMGEKNTMIEVANKNNIKLLQELERVIGQLDVPHVHQLALTETDLTSMKGLQLAKDASKALQNAINTDIDPALLRLSAVQDQRKRFDKWRAKFSSTLCRHLNNLFIHLGNDLGEVQGSHHHGDLALPKHNHHRELMVYQELMHWMKAMDPNAYEMLTKVYTNSLSKVYERDIRSFFDQAKALISKNHVFDEMNTSISGKSKMQAAKQASVYGILGLSKEQWSTTVDATERQRFDSVLEKVLTELEPIALSEQIFCINFFQLDVLSPTSASKNAPNFPVTPSKESSMSISIPQKRLDRQINEEVRRMMSELFGILESELVSFIVNFEKLDTL